MGDSEKKLDHFKKDPLFYQFASLGGKHTAVLFNALLIILAFTLLAVHDQLEERAKQRTQDLTRNTLAFHVQKMCRTIKRFSR